MPSPEDQPRPLWLRLINAQGHLRRHAGWLRPFDTDRLIRKGLRRAGINAFEDTSFFQGLETLVDSVNREARLNGFGRLMFHELAVRLLEQRALLEKAWAAEPPEAGGKIDAPLVILGLPRTGTTFLHQILACDPRFRPVRTFEIERPVPRPDPEAGPEDRVVRQVQRGIDLFERLAPQLRWIHPRGATWPEECQNILASQFNSLILQHALEVPSYRDWMAEHDARRDLAWHRRFLLHLQMGRPERTWLLKSPQHIFHLRELVSVYPGAMLVQTHREPMDAMASVSSLTWNTQRVFSASATRESAGRGQRKLFARGLERCLAARRGLEGRHVVDVDYGVLCDRPMRIVEEIYGNFRLPLEGAVLHEMKAFLEANRRRRLTRPRHRYSLDEFGLRPDEEEPVWQRYRIRFLGAGQKGGPVEPSPVRSDEGGRTSAGRAQLRSL